MTGKYFGLDSIAVSLFVDNSCGNYVSGKKSNWFDFNIVMRSVHVHPCNIFLFWLDLVQRRCATPKCSLIRSSKDHPHAKIYQTTKRKKYIYIFDLNSSQVYLDDWIWPIISLPRKHKGGHPTKRAQKKLWFCAGRSCFWWELLFFGMSWNFVPAGGFFGVFGENYCFSK